MLTKRIAQVLGWTVENVHSFSLPSLRELIKPLSPKLAHEITILIRWGEIGPPQSADRAPRLPKRYRHYIPRNKR